MTPRQIENLQAGPDTDAAIEAQFFKHGVALLERGWTVLDAGDSQWRDPRKFSTDVITALAILTACPGWQMWQTLEGDIYKVNVQLSVRVEMPDGIVALITGVGTDLSMALAICKAALMLAVGLARRDRFLHGNPLATGQYVRLPSLYVCPRHGRSEAQ